MLPPVPARPSSPAAAAACWHRSCLALLALAATLLGGCASLPSNVQRPVSHAITSQATAFAQMVQQRRADAGARSDSAFRLLDSVELAFNARVALIDGAQQSLDLQYYAIHADSSTEVLLDHLRQAAARGVRVRVLLDDFNTVGKDAQVLRLAFEPNVAIRLFNPLPGGRTSLLGRIVGSLGEIDQLQKRMHNKLFLADNSFGIIGGRNLGDAYFGQDKASNFVDLDVLAAGRVVRDMSASFDRYWNNELAYPVQSLVSASELDALRRPSSAASSATVATGPAPDPAAGPVQGAVAASGAATADDLVPPPPAQAVNATGVLPDVTPSTTLGPAASGTLDLRRTPMVWAPSVLLADKPGKIAPEDDDTATDATATVIDGMLTLMAQAKHDVLIISPYFVPGPQMMERFRMLRERGVRVRVLTNSLASNDAPAAHAGYARYRPALLAMGVELHEMRSSQQGNVAGLGSLGSMGSRGGSSPGSDGSSRASLHSKAVIVDTRLAAIGSMNLDLRSQLQNTEVALLVHSSALAREATRQVEATFASGAYRVERVDGKLFWRAPPGAAFKDSTTEPDANARLRLLVDLIGPFAPDAML